MSRVNRRRAGDVIRLCAAILFKLRQPLTRQQAENVRRRLLCAVGGGQRRRFAVCQQGEIEQAMGVVVGWAKQLAAGNIFINR